MIMLISPFSPVVPCSLYPSLMNGAHPMGWTPASAQHSFAQASITRLPSMSTCPADAEVRLSSKNAPTSILDGTCVLPHESIDVSMVSNLPNEEMREKWSTASVMPSIPPRASPADAFAEAARNACLRISQLKHRKCFLSHSSSAEATFLTEQGLRAASSQLLARLRFPDTSVNAFGPEVGIGTECVFDHVSGCQPPHADTFALWPPTSSQPLSQSQLSSASPVCDVPLCCHPSSETLVTWSAGGYDRHLLVERGSSPSPMISVGSEFVGETNRSQTPSLMSAAVRRASQSTRQSENCFTCSSGGSHELSSKWKTLATESFHQCLELSEPSPPDARKLLPVPGARCGDAKYSFYDAVSLKMEVLPSAQEATVAECELVPLSCTGVVCSGRSDATLVEDVQQEGRQGMNEKVRVSQSEGVPSRAWSSMAMFGDRENKQERKEVDVVEEEDTLTGVVEGNHMEGGSLQLIMNVDAEDCVKIGDNKPFGKGMCEALGDEGGNCKPQTKGEERLKEIKTGLYASDEEEFEVDKGIRSARFVFRNPESLVSVDAKDYGKLAGKDGCKEIESSGDLRGYRGSVPQGCLRGVHIPLDGANNCEAHRDGEVMLRDTCSCDKDEFGVNEQGNTARVPFSSSGSLVYVDEYVHEEKCLKHADKKPVEKELFGDIGEDSGDSSAYCASASQGSFHGVHIPMGEEGHCKPQRKGEGPLKETQSGFCSNNEDKFGVDKVGGSAKLSFRNSESLVHVIAEEHLKLSDNRPVGKKEREEIGDTSGDCSAYSEGISQGCLHDVCIPSHRMGYHKPPWKGELRSRGGDSGLHWSDKFEFGGDKGGRCPFADAQEHVKLAHHKLCGKMRCEELGQCSGHSGAYQGSDSQRFLQSLHPMDGEGQCKPHRKGEVRFRESQCCLCLSENDEFEVDVVGRSARVPFGDSELVVYGKQSALEDMDERIIKGSVDFLPFTHRKASTGLTASSSPSTFLNHSARYGLVWSESQADLSCMRQDTEVPDQEQTFVCPLAVCERERMAEFVSSWEAQERKPLSRDLACFGQEAEKFLPPKLDGRESSIISLMSNHDERAGHVSSQSATLHSSRAPFPVCASCALPFLAGIASERVMNCPAASSGKRESALLPDFRSHSTFPVVDITSSVLESKCKKTSCPLDYPGKDLLISSHTEGGRKLPSQLVGRDTLLPLETADYLGGELSLASPLNLSEKQGPLPEEQYSGVLNEQPRKLDKSELQGNSGTSPKTFSFITEHSAGQGISFVPTLSSVKGPSDFFCRLMPSPAAASLAGEPREVKELAEARQGNEEAIARSRMSSVSSWTEIVSEIRHFEAMKPTKEGTVSPSLQPVGCQTSIRFPEFKIAKSMRRMWMYDNDPKDVKKLKPKRLSPRSMSKVIPGIPCENHPCSDNGTASQVPVLVPSASVTKLRDNPDAISELVPNASTLASMTLSKPYCRAISIHPEAPCCSVQWSTERHSYVGSAAGDESVGGVTDGAEERGKTEQICSPLVDCKEVRREEEEEMKEREKREKSETQSCEQERMEKGKERLKIVRESQKMLKKRETVDSGKQEQCLGDGDSGNAPDLCNGDASQSPPAISPQPAAERVSGGTLVIPIMVKRSTNSGHPGKIGTGNTLQIDDSNGYVAPKKKRPLVHRMRHTLSALSQSLSERSAYAANAAVMRASKVYKMGAIRKPRELSVKELRLHSVIGQGAFGVVHLCTLRGYPKKLFALKSMDKLDLIRKNQIEHVLCEKQALLTLRHPMIVNLEHHFQDHMRLYFLMEFIIGGDLFSRLETNKKLTTMETKFYAAEVLSVFAFIHNKGFVYRDLKPENVMIDATGHIKLADLGFARKIGSGERRYTFVGTPDYLAPEIIQNKGHDKAVDFWALGVLIFELLTGYAPFHANSIAEKYSKIVSGNVQFPPQMDPVLKDLLCRLLQPDPSSRLGSLPGSGGARSVMKHSWFATIDWETLNTLRIVPPFIPPPYTYVKPKKYLDPKDVYKWQGGQMGSETGGIQATICPESHQAMPPTVEPLQCFETF